MKIITNFERFPKQWRAANGLSGETVEASGRHGYVNEEGAVWLVNCDPALTYELAWLKTGLVRLVAADLVLREKRGWKAALRRPVERYLLGRVDHYIHYFRAWEGYERQAGLPPGRSSFVPFKVNLADRFQFSPAPDGDYALCIGRSMRDFDTFLGAMSRLPYRGAITQPNRELMSKHGSRFSWPMDRLPANVEVIPDDGSDESMIRLIQGAKMLVLPVLAKSLVASGISTGLNAMSLGKCVIGTEGPGMRDVFENGEVLVAPPEDPEALSQLIRRAWEDDDLRGKTAAAGYRYAQSVGGEKELYQRVLDRLGELSQTGQL